ncbi:hypothetical protein LCGC14_1551070, partial [marine sediment metagenome]
DQIFLAEVQGTDGTEVVIRRTGSTTNETVPRLASYTPVGVNDIVVVARVGTSLVVLGELA